VRSLPSLYASAVLVLLVVAAAAGAAPAGALSFGAAAHYPTGRGPAAVAVGDFNGDGRPDLVAAGYASNTVDVLLNGAPAVPVIGSLSPTRGHRGATIKLSGWHFGAARGRSLVRFGSRSATDYVSWSDTRIIARVPWGTAGGAVKVTVKTAAGTSAAKGFKRL
jgi:hypothetical protein